MQTRNIQEAHITTLSLPAVKGHAPRYPLEYEDMSRKVEVMEGIG